MKFIFDNYDYLYSLFLKQQNLNNEFFAYLEVKYGYKRVYEKMNISRKDFFNAKFLCESTLRIETMLNQLKNGVSVIIDDSEFKAIFKPNINSMQIWKEKV